MLVVDKDSQPLGFIYGQLSREIQEMYSRSLSVRVVPVMSPDLATLYPLEDMDEYCGGCHVTFETVLMFSKRQGEEYPHKALIARVIKGQQYLQFMRREDFQFLAEHYGERDFSGEPSIN